MQLRDFWSITKQAASQWSDDNASRLGAALAYYSVFSIGPILLIAISLAGLLFGEEAARGELLIQLEGYFGATGAQAIQGLLAGARQRATGNFLVSIGILLFAATGVVIQLKDALNTIWGIKPKPGLQLKVLAQSYGRAFLTVICVGLVLMVSLIATTVIAAVSTKLHEWLPQAELLLQSANFLVSLGVITLLFGALFKILPDAKIEWDDVGVGALCTAVLFVIGKTVIGYYLGRQTMTSTFGAAGTFVIFLLWIYYTSQILFFGAEFTKTYAKFHRGRDILPEDYAASADPFAPKHTVRMPRSRDLGPKT